jgi:hypothetical protein
MSCPNAYVFGVPGQGVHATRVGGTALWDWVFTGVFAIGIGGLVGVSGAWTSWAKTQSNASAAWWGMLALVTLAVFFALVVLGELMHYAWGVDTAVIKAVGLARNCAPPPPETKTQTQT